MNRALLPLVLTLLLIPGWASAEGNVNFVLGGRGLDDDYWRPTEDHGAFGINFDFAKESWPVSLALGLHGSAGSEDLFEDCHRCDSQPYRGETEIEATVGELSVGVLWRPETGHKLRPYLGGGLAFVSAEKESRLRFGGVSDDDESTGFYLNGGLAWRIGRHVNGGLDARLVTGTDVTIFDEEGDADYVQLGVLLGYGW